MTSHPRLPDKLGVEVELQPVANVLENVVFYSLVKILLVGNETGTVCSLFKGHLESLLLHYELVVVDLALMLALKGL